MRIRRFLLLFFFLPMFCCGQDTPQQETARQFTVDAGFSGIQLAVELRTGKTQTLQFRSGLMPMLYNDIDYLGNGANHLRLASRIGFSGEYRYYYNLQKRLDKNKDIRNNGANYVSLLVLYASKVMGMKSYLAERKGLVMAGPQWGFNRPLGDRFLFNLSLGPMYEKLADDPTITFVLYADLRWSYRF